MPSVPIGSHRKNPQAGNKTSQIAPACRDTFPTYDFNSCLHNSRCLWYPLAWQNDLLHVVEAFPALVYHPPEQQRVGWLVAIWAKKSYLFIFRFTSASLTRRRKWIYSSSRGMICRSLYYIARLWTYTAFGGAFCRSSHVAYTSNPPPHSSFSPYCEHFPSFEIMFWKLQP